jgi:hypothetical protein
MLFNRFAVVADGDYRLLHFAYFQAGNVLIDHFLCAVHVDVLESQRKENLEYMGRLGDLSVPGPEKWVPPATKLNVELVSHLAFCRRGSEAEASFHNFSVRSILDLSQSLRSGAVLRSEAVALLKSEVEIHKHFVRSLYP